MERFKSMSSMPRVVRDAPVPAAFLASPSSGELPELNAAARAWQRARGWSDEDWIALSRAIGDGAALGSMNGESAPLAVRWQASEDDGGGLVAWLDAASRPPAEPVLPLPFEQAINLMGLSVWRIDLVADRVHTNAHGYALAGMAPPALPGEGVPVAALRARVDPRDVHELERAHARATEPGAGIVDVHFRYHPGDGRILRLMSRRLAERDPTGRAVSLLGVWLDVTEQVETAEREQAATLGLRLIAEASGVGAWRVDRERHYFTSYGDMSLLLGPDAPGVMPLPEAIERTRQRIHAADWPMVEASLARLRQPDFESGEWSYRVRRDDGALRWLVSRIHRLGSMPGHETFGVIFDVTDQREAMERLRQAERRTALAAQLAGFGIFELDLATGERIWDEQMFRLHGLEPSGAADPAAHARASVHPDDRHLLDDIDAELPRRDRLGELEDGLMLPTLEFRVVRPDGMLGWLCSRATVVCEPGRNSRLIGLQWDITDQKHAAELRRQRIAAEEADQAKSRFLANMSHEIRTPMNAILGMAHLASQHAADARQRNYAQKIERSAKSLLGLINDILDLSKIEADRLELERIEFQPGDVIDHVANVATLQAEEKSLELVFDIAPDLPPVLRGDPLRLGQVLVNLVANAIKFTDSGEVLMRVSREGSPASHEESASLRFEVSDSGAGMTESQLLRLFQPFEQGDVSTFRERGGTGLGLAISQRLVQAMGAHLEVSSRAGRGSRFWFTASFAVARTVGSIEALRPIEKASSLRVLVVDGNQAARDVALSLCRSFGIDAIGAADGWDALRAVSMQSQAGRPFDIALVDEHLPGMDGIDCARQLRDGQAGGMTLILTGTVFKREGMLQRANAAGLTLAAVLIKPLVPSSLLDALIGLNGRPARAEGRDSLRTPAPSMVYVGLRGARVLLVEDNAINQELAGEILREAGVAITLAENGRLAIDLLTAQDFDAVLMDCQMPVMDGYEATLEIRRHARWQTLPIIAMTANAMSDDRERAFASGMDDHIAKPIDVAEMLAKLERWVGRRGPQA